MTSLYGCERKLGIGSCWAPGFDIREADARIPLTVWFQDVPHGRLVVPPDFDEGPEYFRREIIRHEHKINDLRNRLVKAERKCRS